MILYKDVICLVVDNEQGCSTISAKTIHHDGIVPQAKGLFRKKGGGGGGTYTTTATSSPWAGQEPHLKDIFGQAQTQSAKPQQFFPGQTFAPFSPQTEQALNMTEQRAMAGSPYNKLAGQELMKTLGGEYLHGGAGFNAALDAARNRILPDIQSRYASGGRYGSGLSRQAEAQALADSFASQYGQERTNQLNAMAFAPQMAETDYADLSRLAGVGEAREGQAQSSIDEAMARHDFAQAEPSDRLARYLQMIQGNYGGTQTDTSPITRNRGAGILGGALGGAGAGGAFGPWGAGAGALLGGLGGLLY